MAHRLKLALANDLSIAGYHLPLDAHGEIGNNVLLAEGLGFTVNADPPADAPERFAAVKGRPIGVIGHHPTGITAAELSDRIETLLGREPLLQGTGPEQIRSIGVVTGSAAGNIHEAIALGLDAFITGEPSEHAMADAEEGAIHFYAAGHYATEKAGIRRLGELVGRIKPPATTATDAQIGLDCGFSGERRTSRFADAIDGLRFDKGERWSTQPHLNQ
jgi:putative NIF3 family GTP cyclohydrolase 1 type 2